MHAHYGSGRSFVGVKSACTCAPLLSSNIGQKAQHPRALGLCAVSKTYTGCFHDPGRLATPSLIDPCAYLDAGGHEEERE